MGLRLATVAVDGDGSGPQTTAARPRPKELRQQGPSGLEISMGLLLMALVVMAIKELLE